jgi:predicted XRE-type DNA-binding protein
MEKIRLPEAPSIEIAETAEDARKFAVVPLKALQDNRLSAQARLVLAMVCSYCNRAGITTVSQARVASDLGVDQSRVSRAIKSLAARGYVKVLSKAAVGIKGRTLRVIFDPQVTAEDAIAIAGNRESEDLRTEKMKIEQHAQTIASVDNEHWTAEQIRENKERLARELLKAFKTTNDNPKMYNPVDGDTLAVKKAKQEIRARMRQLRGEELSNKQSSVDLGAYNEKIENNGNMTQTHRNTKRCLYASGASSDEMHAHTRIQSQKSMAFEDVVFFFENNLFNGVKSEDDLHMCSMLADRGVDRDLLERYSIAHSGQTVTHIGKLILGT